MTTETAELRKYELMVILSGELLEKDFEKELDEFREFLQKNTNGISHEEPWGKREFATRIKRQKSGYYAFFNFAAMPQAVFELRNNIKLNQLVLRHLLIAVPDDYNPAAYKQDLFVERELPREKAETVLERGPEELKPMPAETAEAGEEIGELKKKIETKIAGKEEKEQLASVEKKLEKILENPDISVK